MPHDPIDVTEVRHEAERYRRYAADLACVVPTLAWYAETLDAALDELDRVREERFARAAAVGTTLDFTGIDTGK